LTNLMVEKLVWNKGLKGNYCHGAHGLWIFAGGQQTILIHYKTVPFFKRLRRKENETKP